MIYEYACEQCEKQFEATQKITDDPLEECPLCREEGKDSPKPKRLISLSAFSLKGGGWASSGYGNK
jgi:putative FmdB family regulatory protein